MRQRRIGSLDVSVVGLGCNNFGRRIDGSQTHQVIDAALDNGINFLDTANSYGSSESLIGKALGSRREKAVIATKFGWTIDERNRGASPAYVRRATEESLRRLRTDYIDLLQVHRPDPDTPIGDTLGALSELVAEGKIRHFGVCNFSVAELEAAQAAAGPGTKDFVSMQGEYSLLDRAAESTTLAYCDQSGLAYLPFHPLFNGLLSGKYRPGEPWPEHTRITAKPPAERDAILSDRNMRVVADLTAYAAEHGHTLLGLAFSWLIAHPVIGSVIAGASTADQVIGNSLAGDWELSDGQLAEISSLAGPAGKEN